MSAPAILLVGAGGHARACLDVIEQSGTFRVAGFIGTEGQLGEKILGYEVLGLDEDIPRLIAEYPKSLVSVGQITQPDTRIRLFTLLERSGAAFPIVVSPRAYVSPHAAVAAGTIVMHGAIVNAGAIIGRNCIINSQSLIEHDVIISDHCHIATAAAINSGVRVGAGSFIGSNSCVRQGTSIGERCIIGMGQRVLRDCAAGTRMAAVKSIQ